ncbi:MAG: MerR family transcriptional regulator [Mogibacterium sp.]|nr:MerR family transcriptional regulator [Mogibacterium sp.]
MSLNTIREVTEITGITVNALRYYDQKGVLHPTVRNPEGRKEWLYDDEAVRRAKRILLLRRIGIPVESMTRVIDKMDGMEEAILRTRLEELREERKLIDEQISLASMLLLIEELPSDAEIKDDLLDKMFERICLDG